MSTFYFYVLDVSAIVSMALLFKALRGRPVFVKNLQQRNTDDQIEINLSA